MTTSLKKVDANDSINTISNDEIVSTSNIKTLEIEVLNMTLENQFEPKQPHLLKTRTLAVLTDLKGTIFANDYGQEIRFPYVQKYMESFLKEYQNVAQVQDIISAIKAEVNEPKADLDRVMVILKDWIETDKKNDPVVQFLMSLMCSVGSNKGDLKGNLFEDAYNAFSKWNSEQIPLYLFSSDLSEEQELSKYSLFTSVLPSSIGSKSDTLSYKTIASIIQHSAHNILFFSDTVEKLNAAKLCGMQTVLVCREGKIPSPLAHKVITSFDEIQLSKGIQTRSHLEIYSKKDTLQPIVRTYSYNEIVSNLQSKGIIFEKWEMNSELPETANNNDILHAFKNQIDNFKKRGYELLDGLDVSKVQKQDVFQAILFVRGSGLFSFYIDDELYHLTYSPGDFCVAPYSVYQLFLTGDQQQFTSIRFHKKPLV